MKAYLAFIIQYEQAVAIPMGPFALFDSTDSGRLLSETEK